MSWKTLTIAQVQQIEQVRKSITKDDAEIDIDSMLLSIVLNKPIEEIDAMPYGVYLQERKKLEFLNTQPSGVAIDRIKINGHTYRFIYDIRNIPFARYVEVKEFNKDFIGNLHKIAASITVQQKRTVFGWRDKKFDVTKHEQYANDMLQCPFEAVYASCMFFFRLYKNWIAVSQNYLVNEAVKSGLNRAEANEAIISLTRSLDGFLQPNS
jgi:hypothetical protein